MIGLCEPLPGCSPSAVFPEHSHCSIEMSSDCWKLIPSPLKSRIVHWRIWQFLAR